MVGDADRWRRRKGGVVARLGEARRDAAAPRCERCRCGGALRMFVMIKSIGFAETTTDRHRAELRSALGGAANLPDVESSAVMETLPHAYNGGELLWRMTFADEASYRRATGHPDWQG